MPIDFPNSPTVGQVYTYQGKSWIWNGSGWDVPRALNEIGAVRSFANAADRTAAIPSPTEGIVSYLNDVDLLQTNNGSAWVTTGNAGINAYNYVQTLYYTSSGTFTKADYPWLRAIKVKVQGAGGGSGGAALTGAGQVAAGSGGAGGNYAESFITNISGLAASVTVTVGAGGAAGTHAANGGYGGNSSFGSIVIGSGGGGGDFMAATSGSATVGAAPLVSATGDLIIRGSSPMRARVRSGEILTLGQGAGSFYGGATNDGNTNVGIAGSGGRVYGGGASGGFNYPSAATNKNGAEGAPGIVIVELYA
jgi:hypothetical protein